MTTDPKPTLTRSLAVLVAGTSLLLVSALFALPQTLVFRVLKHPKIEFFQCTSMNFFRDLFNGSTTDESPNFYSLTPEMAEKMYSALFLVRACALLDVVK